MFKCCQCKTVFETLKVEKEYRGEFWGFPAYEDVGHCPQCGSEDYEEYDLEEGEEYLDDEEDVDVEAEEKYFAKLLGWDL